jgi:hypothetical protein
MHQTRMWGGIQARREMKDQETPETKPDLSKLSKPARNDVGNYVRSKITLNLRRNEEQIS